uniref:Ig-like domain-containing protein n=1 Tax=Cyprinodon variegatus TaxID=28743 RepID=A0A3Q2CWU6_CYPVA
MTLICFLIWTLLCFTQESDGQNIVLSQPEAKSVQLGQSVTIECKTSVQPQGCTPPCLSWYQKKAGEAPKALIYLTSSRFLGISSRFTGSGPGSGMDFSLTISGVQAEDAGVYYCLSTHLISSQWSFTQLEVGSDTRPVLTVLPPSSEDLHQGKAIFMCLANKGFPSDWSLSWKVDGSSSSSSWEENNSRGVLQKDGLYSWSSTLRLPADQWRKVGSVTCEATQGSQCPVTETLKKDQCF